MVIHKKLTGPGWHSMTHLWVQADFNCFPHISPQECGTSHAWFVGLISLLQKQ